MLKYCLVQWLFSYLLIFEPAETSAVPWEAASGSTVLQVSNLVLTRVQRPTCCSCLILAAEQSVVNHCFMYRKKLGFCPHKRKHLEFFFSSTSDAENYTKCSFLVGSSHSRCFFNPC